MSTNTYGQNITLDYYKIGQSDEMHDYYGIYYSGDLNNFKSVWVKEPHFLPLIIVYTSVFLTGIAGNALVLFAILGNRKSHNVTFLFMISLAVADLLFVVVCVPMDSLLMIMGHWNGDSSACKLSAYVEMLSALASIFNLTVISIERYIVIVMPLKSRKNITVGRILRVLTVVWVTAALLATPAAIIKDVVIARFHNNITEIQTSLCGENADNDILLGFAIYQLVIMLVIPTVVMGFCYIQVIRTLWMSRTVLTSLTPASKRTTTRNCSNETTSSRERTKCCMPITLPSGPRRDKLKQCIPIDNRHTALKGRKQVVKMLITVGILFLICWGPKLILLLFKRLRLNFIYYPVVFQAQIGMYCLTHIQSCMNPIIYGLMCKNFRLSLKAACWKFLCAKCAILDVTNAMEMDSRNNFDSQSETKRHKMSTSASPHLLPRNLLLMQNI